MKRARTIKALLCAATMACALLTGCEGAGFALDQGIVLTTSDEYLSQMRATLVPGVSAGATMEEGTLTVGLRDTQAWPLVVESEPTDAGGATEVDGLDVAVACELAQELGLRVTFVHATDVGQALGATCDVVMGVSPTDANGFEVVGSYAQTATALFRNGTDATKATADEVRAGRIAVQNGSSAQQTLARLSLETNEVPCESLSDAFDALAAGEVDFVACSSAAGSYLGAVRGGISLAGTLEEPTTYGVAVATATDATADAAAAGGDGAQGGAAELAAAVRDAMARLEGDGSLKEARRSWLGNSESLDEDTLIEGLAVEDAAQADTADAANAADATATNADATDAAADEQNLDEDSEAPQTQSDGTSTETEVIAGTNAATL